MIKGIETLAAELDAVGLRDTKSLHQREIDKVFIKVVDGSLGQSFVFVLVCWQQLFRDLWLIERYTPAEKAAYWRRAYRRGYYGYGYRPYGYYGYGGGWGY